MSSLIDASVTVGQGTPNGECESGIIHFDATQRRKDKMRKKSQDAPAAETTPPPAAPKPVELPKSAPAPVVAKTPEPAPPKPASNGAATLDAYTTPQQPAAPTAVNALSKLSGEELKTFLIDFVVEQTGYPSEMVELDADLEADLGIDSIKKAQLFGELAERFQITVDVTDESLSLDDFPTLAHVMEFLQSQSGSESTNAVAETPASSVPETPAAAAPAPSANGSATPVPSANGNGIHHAEQPAASVANGLAGVDLESFLVDFVVEQTGYPPEMVELDADLEADLGIDSIKKAQLFGELAEQFQITVDVTDESLSLDDFPTLRHVMEFLQSADSAPAPAPKPEVAPQVTATPQPASNGTHSNGTHSNGVPAMTATKTEPAAEVPSVTGLAQEELETFLVNFVVEQTGYPPEMVELDADLEADLGIDSIKKAQMMGELAEQFEITVDVTDENLSLDDFPTLRHVCEFLASPGKVSA